MTPIFFIQKERLFSSIKILYYIFYSLSHFLNLQFFLKSIFQNQVNFASYFAICLSIRDFFSDFLNSRDFFKIEELGDFPIIIREFLFYGGSVAHRSSSPAMTFRVASTATASLIIRPSISFGSTAKWKIEGGRTRVL